MSFNSTLHAFFYNFDQVHFIKNNFPSTGNGINKSAQLTNRDMRRIGVWADQSTVVIPCFLIEDLRKQCSRSHIVACGAITASTQVH